MFVVTEHHFPPGLYKIHYLEKMNLVSNKSKGQCFHSSCSCYNFLVVKTVIFSVDEKFFKVRET